MGGPWNLKVRSRMHDNCHPERSEGCAFLTFNRGAGISTWRAGTRFSPALECRVIRLHFRTVGLSLVVRLRFNRAELWPSWPVSQTNPQY